MSGVVGFDSETRGLSWFDPAERAFLVTWSDDRGDHCARLDEPKEVASFEKALRDADEIVAHNLAFDVHHVREAIGLDILKLKATLHDTDLLSRVIYPEGQRKGERGSHGLKHLAKIYLRADADAEERAIKDMGKAIGLRTLRQTGAYYEVWRAYPDVMERYAIADARYTRDLFTKFKAKLEGGSAAVYDLERKVAPILIRAEQHGVALDQKVVRRLVRQTKAQAKIAEAELDKTLGDVYQGEGSDEGLREALLKHGVPLHRTTPSGQLATHKFALQEFEDTYPILKTLSDYRTAHKFLATYLEPMLGRDVVHPSFMQIGAWTGRMSCRRPNMQNIPKAAGKEVRSMFVPRPGHSFVVCDYEGIEMMLLAHYLGDEGFRTKIDQGWDPHPWMASNIYGGGEAEYQKGTAGQVKRDVAKNTLYAICYGAGAPRVADMNKMAKYDAKAMIATIKGSLPNFYRLQSRVREKIKRFGYVNTVIGRKQVVAPEKSYVGLNALIQGSAADIMKLGLVNVDEVIQGFGARILLVVHDEVVIECPIEHADKCLAVTQQALSDAYPMVPRLRAAGSTTAKHYADA